MYISYNESILTTPFLQYLVFEKSNAVSCFNYRKYMNKFVIFYENYNCKHFWNKIRIYYKHMYIIKYVSQITYQTTKRMQRYYKLKIY